MKKIHLLILFMAIALCTIAQPPQAFKYQAVVRDNTGEILSNQVVGIRISIHDSIAGGTVVYQETHSDTTNQFGLVNPEIGNGTPTIGSFAEIDWRTNSKFLEIEIDPSGGSNYVSIGTSQLLSVPYALYAEDGGNWIKDGNDLYSANSGNVGIGTTNPGKLLDIYGHDARLRIESTSIGSSLELKTSSGNTAYLVQSSDELNLISPADVAIRTNGGITSLHITSDGKVGIGTTSPVERLVIRDYLVDFKIAPGQLDGIPDANWTTLDMPDEKNLRIWDNLSISGNVGIGTTNPVYKLDVHGNYGWHAPHNFQMRGDGEFSFDFNDGDGNDYWHVWDPVHHSILTAKNNGNVGIGTSSPSEKLDVNGNLKVLGSASSDNIGIDLQIGQSVSGKGGKVFIRAGYAQDNYSSNHWGGDVEIMAGTGVNNSGGDVTIEGGRTSIWTLSTLPTEVSIYGGGIDGAPGVYGSSGLITIEGGKQLGANSSNRSGGNILLMPGTADGSGTDGNVGIGTTNPGSKLSVPGLPEYADNAAAIAGGLSAGDFYRTGDLLKVVH